MLSPEYLLRVSEGGEEIAESLHNEILTKIIDRIALRLDRGDNYILTTQDKWQIEVLQESGLLLEEIQKILAKSTGLMQKEIAEAMEDAGVKALEYDDEIYRAAGLSPKALEQSPHLIRLMQRTYEATAGEWNNFTRTMADTAQRSFIQACNNAYMQVASGAFSYSEAFADAITGLVSAGVVVTYPSGHRDTIETATMRCIRTGVSQATAQITDARMEEMDWDIILVSSHLGARVTDRNDFTNHFWWQGKFYSRSGKDTRFPPYAVCGEGNVQGIHGANCRHSHGPGDGEFNPYDQYDSDENQKEYELQQRQRIMERRIRDSKRQCMGLKEAVDKAGTAEGKAKAEAEYQKQAALLQKRNAAYNQFCEGNDLKKQNERITIAKWDRKQAAKARTAAKKQKKTIKMQQFGEGATPPKEYDGVFDDFADLKLSDSEQKALSTVWLNAKETGNEYGIVIENGVTHKPVTSNLQDSVELPLNAYGKHLTLLHSHTNATPLSATDFAKLLNEKVDKIGVIGYNSDAYIAYVGNGEIPSKEEFDHFIKTVRHEVDETIFEHPDFFDWTPEERNYMAIREQAYRIAQNYGWTLEGGRIDVEKHL